MAQYKRFTGLTALFFAFAHLLGAPSADATPAPTSVCETGYRGQAAYDRRCLTTGTVGDAGALWHSIPKGKRTGVRDDMSTRRAVCTYAKRYGGLKTTVTELITDITYDNYRNHKQVNAWTVDMARVDCTRMGYKV